MLARYADNQVLRRGRLFIKQIILLLALLTAFHYLCHIFVADQFVIPTSSMEPTLMPGDRVIVDKTVMGGRIYTDYGFKRGGQPLRCFRMKGRRRLKHNDIVVFNYTHHDSVPGISFEINNVWCKRIVALPGDTLWIENGRYRNNNFEGVLGLTEEQRRLAEIPDSVLEQSEPYVTAWLWPKRWTVKEMGPYYIPRSGDVIRLQPNDVTIYREIIRLETGLETEWDWERGTAVIGGKAVETYTFSGNYYFMAGDNVCNSCDSRFFGLVPEDYIIGVVKLINYSRDRQTDKIKWDRVLKAL